MPMQLMPAGSKIITRWVYDNSTRNPGNPDPTAQVSSMPFGRPAPNYYEGLHRSTEIGAASKLIWYGDGGCGSPNTWADDSWWIKNTDTSGGGSSQIFAFIVSGATWRDPPIGLAELVLGDPKISQLVDGQKLMKRVVVPDKLVNLVMG